MSLEATFSLITMLLTVGIFLGSIENLILFYRLPAIAEHPLNQGIIKSKVGRRLSFFYNKPTVWIWPFLRLFFACGLLISVALSAESFIWPLGMLSADIIGSFRTRFLPSSNAPLNRLILTALIFHYGLNSQFISNFLLIVITSFLSLAYFAAGLKKVQSEVWKNGDEMMRFATESNLAFKNNPAIWKWFGFLILTLEMFFFMGLANKYLAIFFLTAGFLFHFYLYFKHHYGFFFWTFIAAYPAYFYTAEIISHWVNNLIH